MAKAFGTKKTGLPAGQTLISRGAGVTKLWKQADF